MPGGIGPVSKDCVNAQRQHHHRVTLSADAGELQIFYHLGAGCIHYCAETGWLYFVESSSWSVVETITAVLQGLGRKRVPIDQCYLDEHRLFKSLRRIRLSEQEAQTICVALRLQGVRISYACRSSDSIPG